VVVNAEPGAYYGWNVGALVLLAACAVWLGMRGSVTQAKFVAVLAGFTFAITCILRYGRRAMSVDAKLSESVTGTFIAKVTSP